MGREKMGLTAHCHNLWDAPPPEKQGEGRKRRGAVGEGPGGVEAVAAMGDGCKSGCPGLSGRCGSNGSRWRGNAVRRRAVSKTVVGSSAPCTEKREKPNRTKTAPKQTEKRGKRAGEKRDNRKLSQRVSVFFRGAGGVEAVAGAGRCWPVLPGAVRVGWPACCRAAALGAPGPVPSPWPGSRGAGKNGVTTRRHSPCGKMGGRKERRGF